MKKLKFETFGKSLMGKSGEEKVVDFVNEHNIKKENILKIMLSTIGEYVLFYYVE